MGIRSFIAVEIDETVRRGLMDLVRDFREARGDVKWVEPENVHLTVKFLGDVADGDIRRVCGIMDEAVAGVETFGLTVAGAGSFPPGRRPRVVWVGAREAGQRLPEIHRRLEAGLTALGVAPDGKPFVAHLTLGRVRSGKGAERLAERIARAADRQFGEVTVEALTLFESTLTPQGPIYAPLYRARLGRPQRGRAATSGGEGENRNGAEKDR